MSACPADDDVVGERSLVVATEWPLIDLPAAGGRHDRTFNSRTPGTTALAGRRVVPNGGSVRGYQAIFA